MAKPIIGRWRGPQSLRQLTRGLGYGNELTGFLLPFARADYFYKEYDFCEDTISSDWTVSNSSGTNAASFAHVAGGEHGTISAATGTTDNGGVGFIFDNVMFDAARNPGMHVRMKVDAVTDVAIEIGICDPPTAASTICVTDVDTPTVANGVTDGAFVMMDTDQTLKTMCLVTDGTTDACTKVSLGGFAPTAGTYFDVILQVFANKAYAIINNNPVYAGSVVKGPDTGVKLQPVITIITRVTTTRLPTIDLIRLWAERV
jgi:hypothetical protein